jgi:hypothetical protein
MIVYWLHQVKEDTPQTYAMFGYNFALQICG